jgi:hypothetical protein
MSASLAVICGSILVCLAAPAFAADAVPNIKGKWVGKTYSIVAGSGAHWPSSQGTFEKPGLFEKDITIEVKGQEGRRFWGMQTFTGNGEKTEEPMIGELTGEGNRTVVLVDSDGFLNGRLTSNNVLSFCYTQVGGGSGRPSVVSCTEIKRAP